MEAKDLELQNKSSNTALSLAATAGNVETAKIMVKKNKAVLEIPGSQGMMPLYVAALFARDYMVRYLHANSNNMSSDFWTNEHRGWVLLKCVEADIYGKYLLQSFVILTWLLYFPSLLASVLHF